MDITSIYNVWRQGNSSVVLNYGLLIRPQDTRDNYDTFVSSRNNVAAARPMLEVHYAPQPSDRLIRLKWPLGSFNVARRISGHAFGENWPEHQQCGSLSFRHDGIDYYAPASTAVFSDEDGIVKDIYFQSGWGYRMVFEHTAPTGYPTGTKYTTVYWHVTPSSRIKVNDFVPRGTQVATVYNLGRDSHFHLGIRLGAYSRTASGTGGLPITACVAVSGDNRSTYTLPAFPDNFINPENAGWVQFLR